MKIAGCEFSNMMDRINLSKPAGSSISNHVTLDIYNIPGQWVDGLVDDYLNSGRYNIEWNADKCDAPSGIYFYRIHAGDYIESKKMLLIK